MSQAYRERAVINKAVAIINRAREAGIPERYLRIPPDDFKTFLSKDYHKNIDAFVGSIYDNPVETLFKKPFIIIDGGDVEVRKKAAFAILFRMIACDFFGEYKTCHELIHKFQTIKVDDGLNRNQLAEELKGHDVLLISEFNKSIFSSYFESGAFFDEVLSSRSDNMKPTIFTFSEIIDKEKPIMHKDCGEYLANFSIKEESTDEVFRIRVRVSK